MTKHCCHAEREQHCSCSCATAHDVLPGGCAMATCLPSLEVWIIL